MAKALQKVKKEMVESEGSCGHLAVFPGRVTKPGVILRALQKSGDDNKVHFGQRARYEKSSNNQFLLLNRIAFVMRDKTTSPRHLSVSDKMT